MQVKGVTERGLKYLRSPHLFPVTDSLYVLDLEFSLSVDNEIDKAASFLRSSHSGHFAVASFPIGCMGSMRMKACATA